MAPFPKSHQADRTGGQSFFGSNLQAPKPAFPALTLILKTLKSCDLLTLGVVEDLTLATKHTLTSLYGNMQESWHWVCHQISDITNLV